MRRSLLHRPGDVSVEGLLDDRPHNTFITQPRSRHERILDMLLDAVGRIHGRRYSALGVGRVRLNSLIASL